MSTLSAASESKDETNGIFKISQDKNSSKNRSECATFYTLYAYKSARNENIASKPASIEHLNENEEFRLSLLASNLPVHCEVLLRIFIAKKLTNQLLRTGGSVSGMDFRLDEDGQNEAECFYAILQKPTPVALNTSDDIEVISSLNQQFVFCFITSSFIHMELFQHELQDHCERILSVLDPFASEISLPASSLLEHWFDRTVKYTAKCMNILGEDVAAILYSSMMNGKLYIRGGDADTVEDIQRFAKMCSVFVSINTSKNEKDEDVVEDDLIHVTKQEFILPKVNVTIIFEGEDHRYEITPEDSLEYMRYCDNMVARMLTVQNQPDLIKQLIENFKISVVQELNTFRRMVNEAETDFYALFRAFNYLKWSEYGLVILQHTKYYLSSNSISIDVIQVLEDFLKSQQRR